MKGFIRTRAFAMALMVALSTAVMAQTDSTGSSSLVGNPQLSAAQTSGGGTGGATLLPYEIRAGWYVNRANYALQVTVTPTSGCYDEGLYVDGQQVARTRDDCEWSFTSMTAIVPPGSSFGWNRFNGRVTAMSSGATWEQTQVRFPIGSGFQWLTGPWQQNCPYGGYKVVGTGRTYTTYNYGGTEYGGTQYYEQSYYCQMEDPWWMYGW